MNYKETAIKILTECSRLLIGVVFIFSGFVKAVDPTGGAIKIGDYLTSFGLDMLQPFTVLASFLSSLSNTSVCRHSSVICLLRLIDFPKMMALRFLCDSHFDLRF